MGIRTDLHDRIDDALAAETRLALAALRRLVDDDIPWLEQHIVGCARRSGYSWDRIGRLLGRSRQAVRKHFANADVAWRPPGRRVATEDERRFAAARRRDRYRDELARWEASGDDIVPW